MPEPTEIRGTCNPRFARVRETFAQGFESGAEVGAAVSAIVDGERVVDLWAGVRDAARALPWERDTLVNVFSTTKGMTALCAHQLADRRRLDLDAPVAKYWPEFAAQGKDEITVRDLLCHRAGLPALRERLPAGSQFDWETMTTALAAEKPWWTPGTRHGYHAMTFGWLVGEVVRRVDGRSLGTYFREEVAEPLGADVYIGFGPELDDRVADLIPGPVHADTGPSVFDEIFADPESMLAKSFFNPPMEGVDVMHSREWRAAELPAANGHASAAGLATVYGAVACGEEVLSAEAVEGARAEQVHGKDALLPLVTRIASGFMLAPEEEPCGPNPRAFNHAGAGGSLGYCDPDARAALGYTMNHTHVGNWLVDPRPRALVDALYASLDA